MPDLLLHVGWPKTGTTSLQKVLAHHPNIAGKPFARPGGAEGKKVTDNLLRSDVFDPERMARHLTASQHDPDRPVVYSVEGCIAMPPNHWCRGFKPPPVIAERLARASSGWDARVLVTTRDGRGLLRSAYGHAVRNGSPSGYTAYLTRIAAEVDREEGAFAAGVILDTYRRLFGAENVAVLPMGHLIAGTFWTEAAEALALPSLAGLAAEEVPHENRQRLGPLGAEVLLNRVLVSSKFHPATGLRRIPARRFRKTVLRRVPGWASAPRFAGHDEALEDRIAARFDTETGAATAA